MKIVRCAENQLPHHLLAEDRDGIYQFFFAIEAESFVKKGKLVQEKRIYIFFVSGEVELRAWAVAFRKACFFF